MAIYQHSTAHEKHGADQESVQEGPEEALARYTWYLMLFTGLLALATIGLGWATVGLYRAGNREFLSTHRPRLRVRSVRRYGGNPANPIKVRFAVVNVGNTEAELLGSQVLIDFFESRPPIDFEGEKVARPRRFLPGASDAYLATSARKGLVIQSELTRQRHLFVTGWLVYRDRLGTARTTAFCRRWDAKGDYFVRIDDPDYEYED